MSIEQIVEVARYAGRDREFLSIKKYGFVLDESILNKELYDQDYIFERDVLGSKRKSE